MQLPRALIAGALLLAALIAAGAVGAQTGPAAATVEYASVEVVGFVQAGHAYQAAGWGSGVVVDAGGSVLTAFHVVGDRATGRLLNPDGLAGISMVRVPGTAPVPSYLAQVVTYSVPLDLALLDIRMRLDGSALPAYTFFPAITLPGLRDRVPAAGDTLTAYGYAAGFNQPLVAIPGTLSRQGAVEGYAGRPLLISATVAYAPALTGGPVLNAAGALSGLAIGQTGQVSDVQGVARAWDEILAWATGQITQTQSAPQIVISGRVIDGSTRRGIRNAVFYILRPRVTAADFLAHPTDADVAARGGTDGGGMFMTVPPVPAGVAYNMVVYAAGYELVYTTQPILLDDAACPSLSRCDFGAIELQGLRQ